MNEFLNIYGKDNTKTDIEAVWIAREIMQNARNYLNKVKNEGANTKLVISTKG